jgi:hypothetical protein
VTVLPRRARHEEIIRGYVECLARLAFRALAIVNADLPGEQPPELSAETLLNCANMPLGWARTRHQVGASVAVGTATLQESKLKKAGLGIHRKDLVFDQNLHLEPRDPGVRGSGSG